MPQAIEGVATSITAFVGFTPVGPINEPTRVTDLADFEAKFGAIEPSSDVSYAVAHFFLNGGAEAWVTRVVGEADPAHPTADEFVGSHDGKTGIHALEKLDLFNIVAAPNQSSFAVHEAMIALAERRRAFALLDLPAEANTLAEARSWMEDNEALRHRNAAIYFPRIQALDPAQGSQLRSFANSGAIAGIYARTDQLRGVWKAPAGIDVGLVGEASLECVLNNAQQEVLNRAGMNVLRNFPIHGNVVWGARTLAGADTLASEWKYVPVRRTALFIEESLYRGLQWAQFEENGDTLWSDVRLCIGAFMHEFFRQGAFQGVSANEAYYVKCDATTTSQADIDSGIMNVEIGFAPLRPAEFLWLRICLRMIT